MSFQYKEWFDTPWSLNGALHQIDPLHIVMHEGEPTPLYEVLGISREEAVEISTPFRLSQLRAERDALIAATDWWVLPDRTATPEQLAYRQALRDITNNFDATVDVVFPSNPEPKP